MVRENEILTQKFRDQMRGLQVHVDESSAAIHRELHGLSDQCMQLGELMERLG